MPKSANDRTFVKITNKDIYDKLEGLIKSNEDQHETIILNQVKTNGKVRLTFWIATSTVTGLMVLAGFLFTHINTHP